MKKIIFMVALITSGYFIYSGNTSQPEKVLRLNKLFDKADSTPVSAPEVKVAFQGAIIHLCEISGGDLMNGYGTTKQCIKNFKTLASEYCFGQLTDFEGKNYYSKSVLKADFTEFTICTGKIIGGRYPE